MILNQDFSADVELLNLFELDSSQTGLKIHQDAAATGKDSARRLCKLKLTTQVDGGYLTPLGIQAAEHAQVLVRTLKA